MGCPCNYDEKGRKNNTKEPSKDYDIKVEIPKNKIRAKEIKLDSNIKNPINEEEIKDLKNDMEFITDALNENNKMRELHGVQKLKQDKYLIDRAHILAKLMLTEGTYDNENIFYKNGEELGMNCLKYENKLNGKQLMSKWYEEKNDYDFQDPNEFECRNFTQMIWKNSEKFGIGYYILEEENENKEGNTQNTNEKKGPYKENENQSIENNNGSKKYCYVALYYPTGNKPGEYEENVLKTKKIINDVEKSISDENGNKETNDNQNEYNPNIEGHKNEDTKNQGKENQKNNSPEENENRDVENEANERNKENEQNANKTKDIKNADELTNGKEENDINILNPDKIRKKEGEKFNEKYNNNGEENSQGKHELDVTNNPDK